MYPPRGRGTSQAAEKSRPLGISLMCSRILLGFFHKGVSVKWDDLVTVCPTKSEKGLTQTHVMGTCHIVQDPLVPNKNILFTASATPPFHREVVFCSLPGSKCFLLGTFNIGRNCLVRKEGCLSASWPARGCCVLRLRRQACQGGGGQDEERQRRAEGRGTNRKSVFPEPPDRQWMWPSVQSRVFAPGAFWWGSGQRRGEEAWASGAGTVWHSREEPWATPRAPSSQHPVFSTDVNLLWLPLDEFPHPGRAGLSSRFPKADEKQKPQVRGGQGDGWSRKPGVCPPG